MEIKSLAGKFILEQDKKRQDWGVRPVSLEEIKEKKPRQEWQLASFFGTPRVEQNQTKTKPPKEKGGTDRRWYDV